jgi:phosphoribosylamine--glycine ligase
MRFLGIGDYCDLAALYMRLAEEGHEVRTFVSDPLCHDTLAGIVQRVSDWRPQLDWIRSAGRDGIILFENVAEDRGVLQDTLRREGFHVIGGSAFGDRLENDRGYAQRVLADIGMSVCGTHEFDDRAEAISFISEHPGRYVLKFNRTYTSMNNYVGRLADGRDVQALLAKLPVSDASEAFVLMEFVEGVEMGVGAYFDGEKFLSPACLDWEHKRFFPGDLGELTGEMGTVVTYDRTATFFSRTLGRMQPLLREQRYCGYINLNTIVNEQGIWPLEFTCRFGYPGFALLGALQQIAWGELFKSMIDRSASSFPVMKGFCVGVVLTTPPFPYERTHLPYPVGLPILFEGELSADDRRNLHYDEVGYAGGQLVTSGRFGWTMVATAVAPTIAAAQGRCNALADRVLVPNVRYRRDIGDRLINGELARVDRLGLFDPV